MDFKDIDIGELGRNIFAKLLKATATAGSYNDILEECQYKGIKYTDESFPPEKKSLISNWDDPSDDVQEKVEPWAEFEWIRANEIEELNDDEGQLAVFADSISPDDIQQGLLGDCYFLSVLSVLTENPERIEKLFALDQMNDQGIFSVRMYKNGIFQEVVVDNFIPCQDGAPCFSKANGNELWVIILEKAWAKVHGSYERIEAGLAHEVMRDLTGAPSFDEDVDDEGIFDKLELYDQRHYMMAASAGSTEASAETLEDLGLVAQHSYGLIAAKRVKNQDGDEIQLVQLRNPWGSFEWKGDWSDDSDCWTPEIKKQVGYVDGADDGTFWMSFEDLAYYFSRVQICKINDAYKYSFLHGSHKRGSFALMRLVIDADGEHTVSVAQKDQRCFERNSGYDYAYCRVILLQIDLEKSDIDDDGDNLEVEYIMGDAGWERDTHLECSMLRRGEYYVYIELDFTENSIENSFAVTCYGASNSTFLRDEKMLFSKEMVLANAYRSMALKEMDNVVVADFGARGAPDIKKYKGFAPEGYGFIIYKNESSEASIREKVTFNNFKGLKLLAPEEGQSYEANVEQGEIKTILLWCDPEGYAMSSSTSTQIMHGDGQLIQMCIEQGKKNGRPDTESQEDYGIYQYSLQHGAGIAYLYVNGSTDQILDEEIEFTMDGLEIEGMPGESKIEFRLDPGQQKLIKLKSIKDGWKIGSQVAYGLEPVD